MRLRYLGETSGEVRIAEDGVVLPQVVVVRGVVDELAAVALPGQGLRCRRRADDGDAKGARDRSPLDGCPYLHLFFSLISGGFPPSPADGEGVTPMSRQTAQRAVG